MNITFYNASITINPPTPDDSALKSALAQAIFGTETEGMDDNDREDECFFCDDEEPTGDAQHFDNAVQAVLDAYDTANRLKQFDKHTDNDFWLLAETIKAQYECDTPFGFALLTAVETGKMRQKTSKSGNPLYKAA